jgi:hypothetical protein
MPTWLQHLLGAIPTIIEGIFETKSALDSAGKAAAAETALQSAVNTATLLAPDEDQEKVAAVGTLASSTLSGVISTIHPPATT